MKFACPKCGQHISAEDGWAGQQVNCPTCAAPILVPLSDFKYWAFISYSSKDTKWGRWLHDAIETYGIPTEFVEHRKTPTGHPAPKRFHPVFRDRDELPASADLGAVIKQALTSSHCLIVICSPNAAASTWVNAEIESFIALGRRDHILAIIVDGEPNAGNAHECFPPALRAPFEPIAADARPQGDGRSNAKLKLLAGMLGVSFDSLKQRDRQRQRRRLMVTGIAGGLLFALVATLIGVTVYQRHAAAKLGDLAQERKVTADAATQKAKEEKSKGVRRTYVAAILKVQEAWEQGDMARFTELLNSQRPDRTGAVELRGFEWYYLWERQNQKKPLDLIGHNNIVSCVSFNSDGQRVASGSEDNTVKIWDVASGKELLTLRGHGDAVTSVCYSPDGRRLASAGDTVKVWDAASGKELFTVPEGSSSVCFSQDGRWLASGTREGAIKVWDTTDGRELFSLAGYTELVSSLAFSPDGKLLSSSGTEKKAPGRVGREKVHTVKVWDMANRQQLRTFMTGGRSVCFSPSGSELASGCLNSAVSVWDPVSGKQLYRLERDSRGQQGHSGAITSISFSPDGKRLASCGVDKKVKVWDVVRGKEIVSFTGHRGQVNGVCFSADGKRLASASNDKTLRLWSVSGGEPVRHARGYGEICISPDGRRFAFTGSTLEVWDVGGYQPLISISVKGISFAQSTCFSPDGKCLALAGGENNLTIWDVATGKPLQTLTGAGPSQNSACFSPDGKRLASAGARKEEVVKVWDVKTGQVIRTFKGSGATLSGICFSPDGRYLVARGDDAVKVWDTKSGEEHIKLSDRLSSGRGICVSPDGKRIAASDGSLKVWDVETGQTVLVLKDQSGVVCFSPDGRRLVVGGSGKVKLLDAELGQELLTFGDYIKDIHNVSFSPDGNRLIVGSSEGTVTMWEAAGDSTSVEENRKDSPVKIWDLATGREHISLKGRVSNANCVSFSPDGERLVTAGNPMKVWDATSGEELLSLQGHASWSDGRSVCFSPDSRRIASGGSDQSVKIWNAASGKEIFTIQGPKLSSTLCFSPDGSKLALLCHDDTVRIVDAKNGKEILALNGQPPKILQSLLNNFDRFLSAPNRVHRLYSVCFSPDGKRIAAGGSNRIAIWDSTGGKELVSLKGHTWDVNSLCFNHDGKRLASGSTDKTIRVWDAESGQQLLMLALGGREIVTKLESHTGIVRSVCFSPDGRKLAAGGWDRNVRVWDAVTGQELLTITGHSGMIYSVCFSPDGKRLATGG